MELRVLQFRAMSSLLRVSRPAVPQPPPAQKRVITMPPRPWHADGAGRDGRLRILKQM